MENLDHGQDLLVGEPQSRGGSPRRVAAKGCGCRPCMDTDPNGNIRSRRAFTPHTSPPMSAARLFGLHPSPSWAPHSSATVTDPAWNPLGLLDGPAGVHKRRFLAPATPTSTSRHPRPARFKLEPLRRCSRSWGQEPVHSFGMTHPPGREGAPLSLRCVQRAPLPVR